MKTKIEGFIEILLLYLFRYPGAFVRWVFTGFTKSFRDIIEKDAWLNGFIGAIVIVLLFVLKRF